MGAQAQVQCHALWRTHTRFVSSWQCCSSKTKPKCCGRRCKVEHRKHVQQRCALVQRRTQSSLPPSRVERQPTEPTGARRAVFKAAAAYQRCTSLPSPPQRIQDSHSLGAAQAAAVRDGVPQHVRPPQQLGCVCRRCARHAHELPH